MLKMKDSYKTREEMERDQVRIMRERIKAIEGKPGKKAEVSKREYNPKSKTGAKKK